MLSYLIAALLCSVSSALFEDQSHDGPHRVDWLHQHVGPLTSAHILQKQPRVVISTSQNVIGSLNLRDGSIAWRRRLSEGEGGDLAVLAIDGSQLVVSVSDGGNVIRAWDQGNGAMRWETPLKSMQSPQALVAGSYGDKQRVTLIGPSGIISLDCKSGSVSMSLDIAEFSSADVVRGHQAKDEITAYAYKAGTKDALKAVLSAPAETLEEAPITLSSPLALSDIAAAGPAGLAAFSSNLQSLCINSGPGVTFSCYEMSKFPSFLSTLLQTKELGIKATSTGFLLLPTTPGRAGAAIISVSPGTAPAVVASSETAVAAAGPVSLALSSGSTEVVAWIQSDEASGSVTVQVISVASGSELLNEKSQVSSPLNSDRVTSCPTQRPARIKAAYLSSFSRKKEKGDGFRLLLVWDDDRVSFIQQGVTVWSRDEALGTVVGPSLFVDLPPPSPGGVVLGFDWMKFSRMQILNIKIQFKFNTKAEAEEFAMLQAETSDRNLPVRDVNGFRKLILLATSSGSVVALHNGDGRKVWTRQYYAKDEGVRPQTVLSWKTHHSATSSPEVVVLLERAPQTQLPPSGPVSASIVDAHSGMELDRISLSDGFAEIVKVVPLHRLEHSDFDQSVYLVIGKVEVQGGKTSSLAAKLLPDNQDTRSWFSANYRNLFFWLEDLEANSISGYGFESATGGPVKVWEVVPTEPIVDISVHHPKEVVQSSVKILGDRSIKYKYLNPNTILVVLGPSPPSTPLSKAATDSKVAVFDGDEEGDSKSLPSLTSLLLDTVTGRVLHRQVYVGASQPVKSLLIENLAVIEFWDLEAKRTAFASLELFDATDQEFSVLDYLFNPNSSKPVSSYDAAPLEVTSLTFWNNAPSRFLASTHTRQGITSRQLLIGSETDQLMALDARFLDPRRPKTQKLTSQEQEERLIPYQERLPQMPFLSYDRRVMGVTRVDVEPSNLESTCLVLARGVDLYYTRMAPAKKYDSLEDDFQYALLVVAMLSLLAGSMALKSLTIKGVLQQKWH